MERLDMDKLTKAIIYVDRIAEGKNPVNNMMEENDSVLNDSNVIRCMYFVKEVLNAVKNNGGVVGKNIKIQKKTFPLESLSSFQFDEKKTISRFLEQINNEIDEKEYEKIKVGTITNWLKNNNFLSEIHNNTDGKKETISTDKGQEIGITHSLQTNMYGRSYYRVEYDKNAQEYIIENLPNILKNSEDL